MKKGKPLVGGVVSASLGALFAVSGLIIGGKIWLSLSMIAGVALLAGSLVFIFRGTPSLEGVKNVVEIVAIAAAGFYFLYQVLDGQFFSSLSVELQCERTPVPGTTEDYLQLTLELAKEGSASSVYLDVVEARVSPISSTTSGSSNASGTFAPRQVVFAGTKRLALEPEDGVVKWDGPSDEKRALNMSSGDKIQMHELTTVPANALVRAEVVIVDWRKNDSLSRAAQWRASCISLPRSGEAPGPVVGPLGKPTP